MRFRPARRRVRSPARRRCSAFAPLGFFPLTLARARSADPPVDARAARRAPRSGSASRSASASSAPACRGSTSACTASAACRRRSRRSRRSASAPSSRSSRRRPAGCRRASPAPTRVRACLLIPAAWVLLEWLRELDPHRLSLARARLRRRSAGRSPGYAPLGGVYAACRSRRVALAGLLWLHRVPAQRAGVAAALLVVAARLRRGAARACDGRRRPAQPVARRAGAGQRRAGAEVRSGALRARRSTPTRGSPRTAARALIVLPGDRVPALPRPGRPGVPRAPRRRRRARNGGDLLLGVPLRDRRGRATTTAWSASASRRRSSIASAPGALRRIRSAGLRLVRARAARSRSRISRAARATQPPLAVAGQRVAVNICYEDVFGAEIIAPAARGDAARQRHQRRLVRRLARARAAPADRAHARARDRPHAPARDQHRHHRGDRRATAACSRSCRSSPRAGSKSRRRATRGVTPYVRFGDWPVGRCCARAAARCVVRRAARTLPVESAARMLDLPAAHPAPERLLGPAGLRAAAALRHGSRRRHLPHRDLPARARPRAVERRLRAAVAPPEGRPLRREPEPPAALLPVPGRAQAFARRHPGSLSRLARGASASTRRSTTSASSRTTGNRRRSAPGAWAGKCG